MALESDSFNEGLLHINVQYLLHTPEDDVVIYFHWNTIPTVENCVKNGISRIIKASVECSI